MILNFATILTISRILFIPIIGTFTCALIDLISLIPFADVIKLLKFRKLGKLAKPATKLAVVGGKAAKAYGAKKKLERIANARSQKSDQDSIDI